MVKGFHYGLWIEVGHSRLQNLYHKLRIPSSLGRSFPNLQATECTC